MTTDLAAEPIDKADNEDVRPATYTASARRLGIVSANGTVLLSVADAIPLTVGLLNLPSPGVPIGDPWFWSQRRCSGEAGSLGVLFYRAPPRGLGNHSTSSLSQAGSATGRNQS